MKTNDKAQSANIQRQVRIAEKLRDMPDYAREFVLEFRRHVELVGRAGPNGCAEREFERFIDWFNAFRDRHYKTVTENVGRAFKPVSGTEGRNP